MKPSIPEVIDLFRAYYIKTGSDGWGCLHIVLEEGNVSNHDIEYCLKYAKDNGDIDGENLANILLKMSKTQRLKIDSIVGRMV